MSINALVDQVQSHNTHIFVFHSDHENFSFERNFGDSRPKS